MLINNPLYRPILLLILYVSSYQIGFSQKPPLNHDVYDGWESVGSAVLSRDGTMAYYVISPQEGDARLYLKDVATNQLLAVVDRPASVRFSPEETHLVSVIKPLYRESREARIQKKKSDELPKDSLAIVNVRSGEVMRIPAVRSYKLPEEEGAYIAYLKEQTRPERTAETDTTAGPNDTEPRTRSRDSRPETVLVIHHLIHGVDTSFQRVDSYFLTPDGQHLYFVRKPAEKDSVGSDAGIVHYDIAKRQGRLISGGKGIYKSLTFDEDGAQLAFLAYKGPEKATNKIHEIYRYRQGADSAEIIVQAGTPGIPTGWQVSEHGSLRFSADGHRLFFGLMPIPLQRDTSLVDFEHAKVDIWHWKDDYLQPQQLVNLRRDQQKSYLAVIDSDGGGNAVLLSDETLPDLRLPSEGAQHVALGTTDIGRRIQSQWEGGAPQDVYIVSTRTGERNLIKENLVGNPVLSPEGKYVIWFDRLDGNWYAHELDAGQTRMLNDEISVSFADEDNDQPTYPSGYGIAGWGTGDAQVFIYDKYDLWQFDLEKNTYRALTNGFGRRNHITLRYENIGGHSANRHRTATTERRNSRSVDRIDPTRSLWLSAFDHRTKQRGWFRTGRRMGRDPEQVVMGPYRYGQVRGAEEASVFIYTKENYVQAPDLYVSTDFRHETQMTAINPQQAAYNWGTAELFTWTTPKGYEAEGIVYKPEDFDPNRKYPVIAYFYEKLSDGLYSYIPPTPTPSRLNISYFVSNGYIVFAPDIEYEIGYPGRSAEEFVNSGMQALANQSWVDRAKLGIQGQSWGGYQVAHLITRTDMYAAAWAGAPVVNMTSAYGGIRWQTGRSRQFQYERTQSRLGVTLWENLDLYIENSPLFYLDRVNTPVAIMHNDEDGAVPWYQGIEMFTALRRLGKPVWMLNYNGDAHNLVQRQNRKDIQRRQQEFFDHFLKGSAPAPWIESGLPAVRKGIEWGFGQ